MRAENASQTERKTDAAIMATKKIGRSIVARLPRNLIEQGAPGRALVEIMETNETIESPEAILDYWLNDVGPDRWYAVDDEVDLEVTRRFMDTWRAAKNGDLDGWMLRPRDSLALLILLDQFPRNMFRGSSIAFSSDGKALCIAKKALSDGHDLKAAEPERQFFYLPLMHSESLVDQDRCVRLFLTRMPKTGAHNLPYAREHRDVIRQFGRFPYRNAALGRRSTPAEEAFLDTHGYAA